MVRRSGRSLTFKDAVRILDDGSPFVRDLDELISHAFDAVPAGKLLALPYFAFRSKLVAYGEKVVSGIRDRVDGVGRYDRTQRLHAAHAVIVMTAFAEALGELLDGADLRVERGTRETRLADVNGQLVLMLDQAHASALGPSGVEGIAPLYASLTADVSRLLVSWGLESADELFGELPPLAWRRYEERYRRLAVQVPEFAVWVYLAEHKATRDGHKEIGDDLRTRLDALTTSLAAIPELLPGMSERAAANRVRDDLANRYQAVLTRSVLGETRAPHGFVLPTLERGYVNPAVRATVIDANCRPSEDGWWEDQPLYDDVQTLIVGALTAADAVDRPLVILGQPGAGKSVLTRILSARLADRGFLPVRVELRNVPADAEIQAQIEYGIYDTTGQTIQWPELARPAREDGLLPLVILDGFDELLQATGVNRTDYLEQVARFQQREFDLGRPVAVIVTSRTAVADRARFPESTTALRIEPFDEARVITWLGVWNATNGTSLDTATMRRFGELAEQPLLLTLLAMYDAGTGALSSTEAELSRAELYDRLLSEFARREVRKGDKGMDPKQEDRDVAKELLRLEVVALAMFNRHAKAITGEELDRDLAVLLPDDRQRAPGESGLEKRLTAAQLMVGRFFFVHESSAQRAGETEHAYEFLHATFGEFLVARYVIETLRSLARLRAFQESEGMVSPLDDGKLWAALSFAALTGSKASVEFTEGLLSRLPDDERGAVRELTVELLGDATYANPRRSLADYEPDRMRAYERHAYYSANLTVLAVLSTGESLNDHPTDMGTWRYALRFQDFSGLADTVRVLRILSEDGRGYYPWIVREDGSDVDLEESLFPAIRDRRDPVTEDRLFIDATIPADSSAGALIRERAFIDPHDLSLKILQPYFELTGEGLIYGARDGGTLLPRGRGLLELRLVPFSAHGVGKRERLYRWCFSELWDTPPAVKATILRQLREDIHEFPAHTVADLLIAALDEHDLSAVFDAFCDVLRVLRETDDQAFATVSDHVQAQMDEAGVPEADDVYERMRDYLTPATSRGKI